MTNPLTLDDRLLARKIMGCWLGKAVGGTLGMPYEGVRHPLTLTFYDPVPTEMLPNDDLDLQVVYAFLLDQMAAPRVGREHLAGAWAHVGMSPDEYGICKRNLKLGLRPPTTGHYDNPFRHGMGAAIRTELWACLAAGDPDLAMQYAYEDACMDHAGEGIYAAQFLAGLEAEAFVEHDRETLLDHAVARLPEASAVGQAVQDARQWWAQTGDWAEMRERLMARYQTDNFTDVVLNLSFIVLGWLAGEGEFGRSLCAAVNAGEDTDCTGATLGALLGILDPEAIEDRWLAPIGRDLVLSPSIHGVTHPPTLEGFTDLVLDLRRRVGGRPPEDQPGDQPTDHLAVRAEIGSVDDAASLDPAALPSDLARVELPGLDAQWPHERCPRSWLVVRYAVSLPRGVGKVRLLFNSPEPTRVWFDGKLCFERGAGPFVPAMHRAPRDQRTVIEVTEGRHEIVGAIRKPEVPRPIRWCVGLGEAGERASLDEWLVGVFDRVGRPIGDGG